MTTMMWTATYVLFVTYLITGSIKLFLPIPLIPKQLQWAHVTRPRNVRAMGLVNLLGGFGVLLPVLTGILPWLAWVAAIGLAIVQIGAIRVHVGFRDFKTLPVNITLLALAACLAVAHVLA
jgi:DoxX-like family